MAAAPESVNLDCGTADATVVFGDGSPNLASTFGVQIEGSWTATLSFECTIDGSHWHSLLASPCDGSTGVTSTTNVGMWWIDSTAWTNVRVRVSSSNTGTAVVSRRHVEG